MKDVRLLNIPNRVFSLYIIVQQDLAEALHLEEVFISDVLGSDVQTPKAAIPIINILLRKDPLLHVKHFPLRHVICVAFINFIEVFGKRVDSVLVSPHEQLHSFQAADVEDESINIEVVGLLDPLIRTQSPVLVASRIVRDSVRPPDAGRRFIRIPTSLAFQELVSEVERLVASDGGFEAHIESIGSIVEITRTQTREEEVSCKFSLTRTGVRRLDFSKVERSPLDLLGSECVVFSSCDYGVVPLFITPTFRDVKLSIFIKQRSIPVDERRVSKVTVCIDPCTVFHMDHIVFSNWVVIQVLLNGGWLVPFP